MPTIKTPLTDTKQLVPDWVAFIAMDSNGHWYAYNNPPTVHGRIGRWIVRGTNEAKGRFVKIGVKNPLSTTNLLNLLNWEQSLFKVEDLICQP